MNIKSVTAAVAIAFASCALFATQVSAVPITGKINFTGAANLDTTNLNTATKVVSWTDTSVTAGNTGSFAGAAAPINSPVNFFSPWNFNSGPIAGFWTSNGFTFDLISSGVFSRSSSFLSVTGTGTISGNGYTPTFGTWAFTVNDSSAGGGGTITFSFAASTSAVPEGGSALALLGVGLIAVELIRRKVATA